MADFAFIATLLVLASLGVRFWVQFIRQPDNSFVSSSDGDQPFGFIDLVFMSLGWLGVQALVASATLFFFGAGSFLDLDAHQKSLLMLMVAGSQLGICAIAVLVFFARYGGPEKVLGLAKSSWIEHARTGFQWFTMVVPVLLCLQAALALLIPYDHATLEQLKNNFSPMTMVATWIGATVSAPICEELVFRGVLQGWLQRFNQRNDPENKMLDISGGWPVGERSSFVTSGLSAGASQLTTKSYSRVVAFWLPIVISSALFAAVHIGQGAAPVVLFFFGLALGYLFRKTGSIVPCIVLHFLLNAFTMFWASAGLATASVPLSIEMCLR